MQSDRAARPLKTGLVRRYQKHRLKTAELATTRGSGCEATGSGKVLSFAGSPKRIFATDGPPSSVQVSIGLTTSHASSPRRSYCRWLSKTVFSARANRASASCKIRDSPIARSRSSLVKTSTPSLSACSMSAFTSSRASASRSRVSCGGGYGPIRQASVANSLPVRKASKVSGQLSAHR